MYFEYSIHLLKISNDSFSSICIFHDEAYDYQHSSSVRFQLNCRKSRGKNHISFEKTYYSPYPTGLGSGSVTATEKY